MGSLTFAVVILIACIVSSQNCQKYKSSISSITTNKPCSFFQEYTTTDGWDTSQAEISCAVKCKETQSCDYGFFLDYDSCDPLHCYLMGTCTAPQQNTWTSCSDDTIYDYQCVASQQYIMTGENAGCSDYDGFEVITDINECNQAATFLNLADVEASINTVSQYPQYCYYNAATTGSLYFNPGSGLTKSTTTRFPICKSSSPITPETSCYSQGVGLAPTGGTITPDINDPNLFICAEQFSFTPYDRTGYMYLNYNPKEQDEIWGVYKWDLNVNNEGPNYEYLYNLGIIDAVNPNFYDTANGIAVDNTRNVLYSIMSHKFAQTGTAYERYLVRIDLDTGSGTTLLHDIYPYHCHPLSSPTFRALMDIDVINNILYWIDGSTDFSLYSLDLKAYPLKIKYEVYVSASDQMSQLRVDCNGNVWFTQIFEGLYLYKPGWNDVIQVIDEANINGIEFIRREGSVEMDWIIASEFTIRNYTKEGLLTNTYATYPSPPAQERIGSDGDIMHNLIWDYQNEKICAWVKTNDGNYMYFCYDPYGDTNLVWNYFAAPLPRLNLGIRYGVYTTDSPTYSPTATPAPTYNPTSAEKETTKASDKSGVAIVYHKFLVVFCCFLVMGFYYW